MANPNVLNKVYDWLTWGYGVYVNGSLSHKIVLSPDGDYFRYTHFGSSSVESTKDELEWLMDVIFETEDFVAIDCHGYMFAIDKEEEFYLNHHVNEFILLDRDNWDYATPHPFMECSATIAEFIAHKEDIVAGYNLAHGTNIVRVYAARKVTEEAKFNRFWFAY